MNIYINKVTHQRVHYMMDTYDLTPDAGHRIVLYCFEGAVYACDFDAFRRDFVPEFIAEAIPGLVEKPYVAPTPMYKYQTDEYKFYTTHAGKKYRVYKNGKVFSECGAATCKSEVIPKKAASGYWQISLSGEQWALHRLVATVWIDKTDGKRSVVDHIDNNKDNNCVENLQWLTNGENVSKGNKTENIS